MELKSNLKKELNKFLFEINENKSSYIHRKNLENIIKKEIINKNIVKKEFSSTEDFLYIIYEILTKCFKIYDEFDKINKIYLYKYLNNLENIYNLDIKQLLQIVLFFDKNHNDNDKNFLDIINKHSNNIKKILKNSEFLEEKIGKKIFLMSQNNFYSSLDQFFKNNATIPPKIQVIKQLSKEDPIQIIKKEKLKSRKRSNSESSNSNSSSSSSSSSRKKSINKTNLKDVKSEK